MSVAGSQSLRVLDGRYVLERADPDEDGRDPEIIAFVRGPDGGAVMRRGHGSDAGSWLALWNGDDAHPPEATGMLAAIVAPLAAGGVSVWTAASYDGDLVFVPADLFDRAVGLLRAAGHRVVG